MGPHPGPYCTDSWNDSFDMGHVKYVSVQFAGSGSLMPDSRTAHGPFIVVLKLLGAPSLRSDSRPTTRTLSSRRTPPNGYRVKSQLGGLMVDGRLTFGKNANGAPVVPLQCHVTVESGSRELTDCTAMVLDTFPEPAA